MNSQALFEIHFVNYWVQVPDVDLLMRAGCSGWSNRQRPRRGPAGRATRGLPAWVPATMTPAVSSFHGARTVGLGVVRIQNPQASSWTQGVSGSEPGKTAWQPGHGRVTGRTASTWSGYSLAGRPGDHHDSDGNLPVNAPWFRLGRPRRRNWDSDPAPAPGSACRPDFKVFLQFKTWTYCHFLRFEPQAYKTIKYFWTASTRSRKSQCGTAVSPGFSLRLTRSNSGFKLPVNPA